MRATAVLVLGSLLVACGGGQDSSPVASDVAEDVASDVVEVFGSYRGVDADAFREVLAEFTARTGVQTRYVGTAAFASRLSERVRDGSRPDVALVPQPALLAELARNGSLVPVDRVTAGLDDALVPGGADVGVVDGRRYGVWFRLHVKSLVWYSPSAFRQLDVAPPTSWAVLRDIVDRAAASGTPPWCLGMESFGSTGWVGTDWIEDIVLRLHGPEVYDDWVDGGIPFTERRIAAAFEEFGELALEDGHALGGARAILSTPAMTAVMPVLDDPAGCVMSRQASFQEADLPADVTIGPDGDVDVFVLPGESGGAAPLVAGGELAVAFDDRPETLALVEFLASAEAGEPWARRGSFLSPHVEFDASTYASDLDRRMSDLVARAATVRFDASDQMPSEIGSGSFWQGMVDLVAGTPLDDVLEQIQSGGRAAEPADP